MSVRVLEEHERGNVGDLILVMALCRIGTDPDGDVVDWHRHVVISDESEIGTAMALVGPEGRACIARKRKAKRREQ